ncbi:MAG: glucan biosynthesis protein D, partial [Alsobacter sp.]
MSLDRRNFLQLAAAVNAAALLPYAATAATEPAAPALTFGPAEPFSYDKLKQLARLRAQKPYVAPPRPDPSIV